MGRFAKFCVDTYRWGDSTFSSYDPNYVMGTGYKFTVRPLCELWSENYDFFLPEGDEMSMTGDDFLSAGIKLHFMAVSYGYNYRISHHDSKEKYKNFSVGFSCNMFEAALNYRINNVGMTITRIKMDDEVINTSYRYDGLHTKTLTADLKYYFNYKHYSQAAVFGMSKIQLRSSGSPFIGLNYEHHLVNLAATEFTDDYDDMALLRFNNYMLTLGYGYNLVLPKNWVVGFSEGLSAGLTRGYSVDYDKSSRLGFTNYLQVGVGCNHPKWFVNLILSNRISYYRETDFKMFSSFFTASLSAGFRFNLW